MSPFSSQNPVYHLLPHWTKLPVLIYSVYLIMKSMIVATGFYFIQYVQMHVFVLILMLIIRWKAKWKIISVAYLHAVLDTICCLFVLDMKNDFELCFILCSVFMPLIFFGLYIFNETKHHSSNKMLSSLNVGENTKNYKMLQIQQSHLWKAN